MFNSPISKTQQELVQAARAATSDYITNGTDLTEAVVKAASAITPLTSEHVRRICEMTYHDAYERLFAEKTGSHQYVSFDPPDAIRASELLDALQLGVNQQHNFDKLASTTEEEKKRKRRNILGGAAIGGTLAYSTGEMKAIRDTVDELGIEDLGKGKDGKPKFGLKNVPEGTKELKKFMTDTIAKNRRKVGLYGAGAGAVAGAGYSYATRKKEEKGKSMNKTASAHSMPRKFQRMNTHEFWTKAASGTEIPDSNPTRELQQVHRDLKDSISTVKSELYAAEHNEKLAMIDMVKQAKAGLSAGHSMEQVLHAALSVVDASEPFMAKTAHDLCATIIEACADHQNSGFRKEAEYSWATRHDPSHVNAEGLYGNLTRFSAMLGMASPAQNREYLSKKRNIWTGKPIEKMAAALQEVNPNHPIPQKFRKLAEANIQRKHLEVTLDELNRNMDYFNEKLKDELTR